MDKHPKKKTYSISPKEYQKILKGVEFISISLVDLNYKCSIQDLSSPLKVGYKTDSILKGQKGAEVSILFSFGLKGKTKNRIVLSIEGEYNVIFSSREKFTKEFHEVFKDFSLKLLMVPYLRDLFYNISLRSNLPPLILPLLKFFPPDKKIR